MAKRFEIRKEIALRATAEQVWQAIGTKAGLATWFQPAEMGPDSDIVVTWEPPKLLVTEIPFGGELKQTYEWIVDAGDEGGAILRLVCSGLASDDFDDKFTGIAWEMYLYTLAQYFTYFAGRPVVYVEAEGPPTSAQQTAWPRLVDALGLAEPVQLGAAVHIPLPGLDPIEGVVDYVTADFLGVRTSDALIRFHGKAPIGMPVGVSHHAYVEAFDEEQATKAWESWLAMAFEG
jgi:hypothetical protein